MPKQPETVSFSSVPTPESGEELLPLVEEELINPEHLSQKLAHKRFTEKAAPQPLPQPVVIESARTRDELLDLIAQAEHDCAVAEIPGMVALMKRRVKRARQELRDYDRAQREKPNPPGNHPRP